MIRVFLFFLFLTPVMALSQRQEPLKVMTFNIRYDNKGDGVNQWSNRKDKVVALLKKHSPDIIGVQEALHHQLEDIAREMKQYQYIGVGRDDGKQKGEYSAIFLRKKRFDVLDKNTFWLSKTPEVPGSKDWDAAITRVATWAKLRDRKSKREFLMMNTHFDHRGVESRKQAAYLLKDRAASISEGLPVVITGDFNFTRDREPYAVLTSGEMITLVDPAPSDPPGTFCNFKVGGQACRAIDYIFFTPQWETKAYRVIDDNDGTHYPSDHLPVMVTIALPVQ